ncbi:DNA/RNA non-specific endonuclease [Actinomadura sp. ATCC 31491]|uniref:DNA/RNA non-specific endonuclease n=1 Tax=Actinomadura luzonensis TaxID=2805427 RepID=A0ABT0G4C5_9ACTN|nr:DNA/RNA non-specific endonuclease [Actinomadura luzonensis]MCK2219415.1 DNA/RNA non-specific endonuclease [Actinomadura luzonensis]
MPGARFSPALKRSAAAGALLAAAAASAVLTTTTHEHHTGGGTGNSTADSTADSAPCERYLQPGHTYRAGPGTFTTDGQGRPQEAVAKTLTQAKGERTGCESTVGNWAGSGDWNGGHLIAASFGGVSRRYNLVPMRGRQINQGLMKRVEDGARACLDGRGAVTGYRVRLHYPDARNIVPDGIAMSLTPSVSGRSRQLGFTLPNKTLPASEVKAKEAEIDKEFEAAGCRKVSSARR